MKRAAPLPPEERRQAILEAVLPLVLEHGRALSTRQIAQACGIAEGTIFRVFASKDALLDEAVHTALDPHTLADQLAGLGPCHDLTDLVTRIVGVLQEHSRTRHRLVAALPRPDATDPHHGFDPAARRRAGEATLAAVADALAPRAAELAVSVRAAAGAILALAFGSLFSATPPTPDAVASVLLHGIAGPPADPSAPAGHAVTPAAPASADPTAADLTPLPPAATGPTPPPAADPDRTTQTPDPSKG